MIVIQYDQFHLNPIQIEEMWHLLRSVSKNIISFIRTTTFVGQHIFATLTILVDHFLLEARLDKFWYVAYLVAELDIQTRRKLRFVLKKNCSQ